MSAQQVEKQKPKAVTTPQSAPVGHVGAAGPAQQAGGNAAAAWKGYVQSMDAKGDAPPPRLEVLDALLQGPDVTAGPLETQGPAPAPGKKDDKPVTPAEMSGIGTSLVVDRFIAAAKLVQKDWGTLTPENRGARLGKAATDELKAINVYEPAIQVANIGSNAGQFQLTTWTLAIGLPQMSLPKVDDESAGNVAGTMFHEARHCEQFHRVARLLAGQGMSASDIAKKMSIPVKTAADAATKPLKGDSADGKEAAPWLDSVYGGGADARTAVLTEMPRLRVPMAAALAEYDALAKDPKADPKAKAAAFKKWQDAYAAWKVSYDKYRALPEEADAWKIGGKTRAGYKGPAKK